MMKQTLADSFLHAWALFPPSLQELKSLVQRVLAAAEAVQYRACVEVLWAFKARWAGDAGWFLKEGNEEDERLCRARVRTVDELLRALAVEHGDVEEEGTPAPAGGDQ